MANLRQSARTVFFILFSAILYFYQGYFLNRQQTGPLLLSFAGLLLAYFFLVKSDERWGWRVGWLFRLSLLLATPWLSDDYARFVWDGRMQTNGLNPYLYLPSQLVRTYMAPNLGLTPDLFGLLNSPDYYTVYPPFNQLLFRLAARLGGNDLWTTTVWLRVWILLAEALTAYLLPRLLRKAALPSRAGLLYWLNPLVILELTGNLHFEAVMVAFCLLAVYGFLKQAYVLSGLALAFAISTKLLPLIFFPLILKRAGFKTGVWYLAGTGFWVSLGFLPFVSTRLIQNFASSLDLYFQKFEFNASLYYLVREAGYWLLGFNIIQTAGLLLSIGTFLGILWISWRQMWITSAVLWITSLYFAAATTVHPWYLTSLVAVSVFTRWRFPLVWSGTAFLSYHAYGNHPYKENLLIVLIAYGITYGYAAYDFYQKRPIRSLN